MTRLKLTWLASEGTLAQTQRTFRIMLILTVVCIVLTTIHSAVQNEMAPLDATGQPSKAYLVTIWVGQWLSVTFFVFVVCLASRTRRHIRQKYRIPGGGCCGDCDDCCTSFWCTCCTIAQMAVSLPGLNTRVRHVLLLSPHGGCVRGTRLITAPIWASVAARQVCPLMFRRWMSCHLLHHPLCDGCELCGWGL